MHELIKGCSWQHESFCLTYGEAYDTKNDTMIMPCCRNDWAGASLVIDTMERAVLSIENRGYFSQKGDLPIIRVEVQCPGLPEATMYRAQMHLGDDKVYRADALEDWGSQYIKTLNPVQLFVHLDIPEDTLPGFYSGEVRFFVHRMFEDEELKLTMPFQVQVADIALPSKRDQKFHLVIWQHPSSIARHHEVALFSDRHFELLEEYTKTLRDMGNISATAMVGDVPWAGQFCYKFIDDDSDLFEYNMIRVIREKDGTFQYDYSILDRYLKLCDKYDMARDIYLFGLIRNWDDEENGYGNITEDYPDAMRIRYIDKADGCAKYMKKKREISDYISKLYAYLEENGWAERCLVSADEPPDMDAYAASLEALHSAAPDFKMQMDRRPLTIDKRENLEFECYTPLLSELAEDEEVDPGVSKRVFKRTKGKNLYSLCCWPIIPNLFLHSPLLEGRLHGPLAEWLDVEGFLRWAYTCWPKAPRDKITDNCWPAGDPFLVYPGHGGYGILSLRYFALNRGIGDFELMQMVKEDCPNGQEILTEIFQKLIIEPDMSKWNFYETDGNQYSLVPGDYERARDLMIQALIQANKDKNERDDKK